MTVDDGGVRGMKFQIGGDVICERSLFKCAFNSTRTEEGGKCLSREFFYTSWAMKSKYIAVSSHVI